MDRPTFKGWLGYQATRAARSISGSFGIANNWSTYLGSALASIFAWYGYRAELPTSGIDAITSSVIVLLGACIFVVFWRFFFSVPFEMQLESVTREREQTLETESLKLRREANKISQEALNLERRKQEASDQRSSNTAAMSSELDQIRRDIGALSEGLLSYAPLDERREGLVERHNRIEASDHTVWLNADIGQWRRDFLNRCGYALHVHNRYVSAEEHKENRREIDEFSKKLDRAIVDWLNSQRELGRRASNAHLQILFDHNASQFIRPIVTLYGPSGERFFVGLRNVSERTLDDISLRAQAGWFVTNTIAVAHGPPSTEYNPRGDRDVVIKRFDHLDPDAIEMIELFGLNYRKDRNKNDVLGDKRTFTLEARARDTTTVRLEFEYNPDGRPMLRLAAPTIGLDA